MINVRGTDFYTAEDAMEYLSMKYSSVIYLLRTYNIPKYKNKYIITKEQLEEIRSRENQYFKLNMLNEENLSFRHKDNIFN